MTIRQHKTLSMFRYQQFSVDRALSLDQRTFGSLCQQRWLRFDVDTAAFVITQQGLSALTGVSVINLYRRVNNGKFSRQVRRGQGTKQAASA